jgi:hypothetical protein
MNLDKKIKFIKIRDLSGCVAFHHAYFGATEVNLRKQLGDGVSLVEMTLRQAAASVCPNHPAEKNAILTAEEDMATRHFE